MDKNSNNMRLSRIFNINTVVLFLASILNIYNLHPIVSDITSMLMIASVTLAFILIGMITVPALGTESGKQTLVKIFVTVILSIIVHGIMTGRFARISFRDGGPLWLTIVIYFTKIISEKISRKGTMAIIGAIVVSVGLYVLYREESSIPAIVMFFFMLPAVLGKDIFYFINNKKIYKIITIVVMLVIVTCSFHPCISLLNDTNNVAIGNRMLFFVIIRKQMILFGYAIGIVLFFAESLIEKLLSYIAIKREGIVSTGINNILDSEIDIPMDKIILFYFVLNFMEGHSLKKALFCSVVVIFTELIIISRNKIAISYQKLNYPCRIWILYSFLFVIAGGALFWCYFRLERRFIWIPDGLSAYYASLLYLSNNFKNWILNGMPLFDFSVSLGRDISQKYIGAIFNPLYLICCLSPQNSIESLYNISIIVRYYMCGITCAMLLSRFSIDEWGISFGSVAYAFCGFAIFAGTRHPFMLGMMVVFPLLIMGIDNVIKKKRGALLTLIVFWSAGLNLYTLYMMSVIAVIIAVIYAFHYYDNKKDIILAAVGCIRCYIVGMLMGAIAWLPNFLTYSASGRIGGGSNELNLVSYEYSYIKNFFYYFTSGISTIGSWTCLGFTALAVPAVTYLFVHNGKERMEKCLKILFIIITALLLIPLYGYIESGLSNVFNRWCFAYALCVTFIIVYFINRIEIINKKELQYITIVGGCYSMILIIGFITEQKLTLLYTALIIVVMLLILSKQRLILAKYKFFNVKGVIISLGLLSLIANEISVCGRYGDRYAEQFAKKWEAMPTLTNTSLKELDQYLFEKPDDSFYRVGANDITLNTDDYYCVSSLNTISDFNSAEFYYNKYLLDNENVGLYDTTARFGMDNRAMMLTLSNVKYYASNSFTPRLKPFGFIKLKSIKLDNGSYSNMYVNRHYIPFGYTYTSYISEEDYNKLNAIEKQSALMQAAMVRNKDVGSLSLPEADIRKTAKRSLIRDIKCNKVTWNREDNKMIVGAGGGSITVYLYRPISKADVYVRLVGGASGTGSSKESISINTLKGKDVFYLTSKEDPYSTYTKGKLGYLGFFNSKLDSITINFNTPGTHYLENIQIWSQNMRTYAENVEKLKEKSLDISVFNDNLIEGSITLEEDRIMCLTIPYASVAGWTAYIDGNEKSIIPVNTLYCGLEIPAGTHTIRLQYYSPGLKICMLVSLIGIVLFIIFVIYDKKKMRRKV